MVVLIIIVCEVCVLIASTLSASADIPKLPPLSTPEEEADGRDGDDQEETKSERKFHKTSGPRSRNPYESDESWFWPLTGVAAIFFPVLFCLCRH